MFPLSIRSRLIFLFTLQIIIIFLAGGFYLDWQFRQTLENELADKIESLAGTVSLQIEGDFLLNLSSGDEQTRTYNNLKNQLQAFKDQTGARRVYLFTKNKTSLVDTKENLSIGDEYVFMPITATEIETLFSGTTVSSTLFAGSDKRLYKTGFAPVFSSDRVVAGLALEGSAQTLEAIKKVRRDLLFLGLGAFCGSIILGFLFSKRITTPVNRLKSAAEAIALGNYESEIRTESKDEIGFLGQTLEDMRKAIVLRDKRQKAMLAGVAHEIRNPLGGIELFAGLLASELTDGTAKSEAQKIQKEVQNLKKIVTDFLNYARPNKPEKQVCDVVAVFAEACGLISQKLQGIKIKTTGTGQALIDPQHLKQIFLNLLHNAIEAMPGSGEISLLIHDEKKSIKITFKDTGPGIPDEIREDIFEPFFTGRKDGTGLGLAIVKSLIEENGGEIWLAQSEKGAAFKIKLTTGR